MSPVATVPAIRWRQEAVGVHVAEPAAEVLATVRRVPGGWEYTITTFGVAVETGSRKRLLDAQWAAEIVLSAITFV